MNSTRDTNYLETMSEISTIQPAEAIQYPNDNEDVEQIFENLYDEMKEILKEIQSVLRKSTVQPSFMTLNNEKTVVLRELEALLENKTRTVSELTKAIKKSKDYEFPRYKGDAVLSIPGKLLEETANCQKLLERLENTNNKNEKYIEFLSKSKQFLEDMNDSLVSPNQASQELSLIENEVNREYKECKQDLKTILETLYPDEEIKEVIGEIIQKSLNSEDETDQWYEVDDLNVFPIITHLAERGILTRNALNEKQFKMILN
ncbi:uncharacterized protein LOC135833391 [Planococcus citri]|uniref:uncharacterized protein LOC135833391 n=1 Tax=Planococcus citri TaxID=170843 RepID=UPI0031F84FE4